MKCYRYIFSNNYNVLEKLLKGEPHWALNTNLYMKAIAVCHDLYTL